jgi:putative hemolysin
MLDDGSKPPLWGVIILLLTAAYFALTETSLSSVSKNRLKVSVEHGDAKAKKVLSILEKFDQAITTILIGTNIVHIATASVVTVYVSKKWGLSFVSLSTILTTIVVFFFGEMLPKSIAKKYPEKISKICVYPLSVFMVIFKPLSALLTFIGQTAAKHATEDSQVSVTEDELQNIIEDMTEEGTLDENQSELITSALQFGDVTVESILTPRVDVCALDVEEEPSEIIKTIKEESHSRLPVYEGSIDNIIGVLQIRKYLKSYLQNGKTPKLREMLDEVYYAPQSMEIHELLPEMSKRKLNMAVITDSYGGTLGIVTVEDILEELVGEIWDEDDVIEEPIIKDADGSFTIESEVSLADVFDALDFQDPDEDDKDAANLLLGEWMYEQFASIPKEGDSFEYHNLKVTVQQMEHNRILKAKVEKLALASEENEEEENK